MRNLGKLIMVGTLVLAACGAASSPAAHNVRSQRSRVAIATTDAPDSGGVSLPATTGNTDVPPALGTRDDPVPAGQTIRLGDWDVTVLSASPNATKTILAENEFNTAPEPGKQFYLVELAATYVGTESEALFVGATFSALGDSSVAYTYDAGCGVVPDEINAFSEVFPGGTVRGNMCWQVTNEDAPSLILVAEPAFAIDSARAFLQLPARGVSFEPPAVAPQTPTGGDLGTRGNPYPLGETVQIGDWDITVLASTPDAAADVAEANPYNDPPRTGYQFFMAEMSATYRGDDAEELFLGVSFATIGDGAIVYDTSAYCGIIPDPIDEFADVYSGGTVRGNLCWQVAGDDAPNLLLMVDSAFDFDAERVFLDLQP